jgi:hypothetical protein
MHHPRPTSCPYPGPRRRLLRGGENTKRIPRSESKTPQNRLHKRQQTPAINEVSLTEGGKPRVTRWELTARELTACPYARRRCAVAAGVGASSICDAAS